MHLWRRHDFHSYINSLLPLIRPGTHILNACPGTPDDVRCCTKTSCGSGGNCRFANTCSTSTLTGLCPGPADFKCCVPGGSSGGYPAPRIPSVGACKANAVNGAQKVVNAHPGKVREIYCTRDCSCPGTSDHCCGLAIDFMCSSAGGVSPRLCSSASLPRPFYLPYSLTHCCNPKCRDWDLQSLHRSVPNLAVLSPSGL